MQRKKGDWGNRGGDYRTRIKEKKEGKGIKKNKNNELDRVRTKTPKMSEKKSFLHGPEKKKQKRTPISYKKGKDHKHTEQTQFGKVH